MAMPNNPMMSLAENQLRGDMKAADGSIAMEMPVDMSFNSFAGGPTPADLLAAAQSSWTAQWKSPEAEGSAPAFVPDPVPVLKRPGLMMNWNVAEEDKWAA